jgi:predicted O-linked N-acetylglucosamine transferase (SPINDLY family)
MIDISQLRFDEARSRCPSQYSPFDVLTPAPPFAVQVAEQVRAAGVHVLVDLTGYTITPRAEVFALRSAPVQLQVAPRPPISMHSKIS